MNCVLDIYNVFGIQWFVWFWFQSRVVPDTPSELVEYLLDTEAQEIEFEIARLRPRSVL